jgi:hypothetical protein
VSRNGLELLAAHWNEKQPRKSREFESIEKSGDLPDDTPA